MIKHFVVSSFSVPVHHLNMFITVVEALTGLLSSGAIEWL